jgi:hypothetical protein
VDRTARNTNMLIWHQQLWLIDHGATLFMHHAPGWMDQPERAREPFALIRQHVLLPAATLLDQIDAQMAAQLSETVIAAILAMVPDSWLIDHGAGNADVSRAAYQRYLIDRLAPPRAFVREALGAR